MTIERRIQPATRISRLPPNGLSALSEARARFRAEGTAIIDLSEGSPDFPPSQALREQLAQSIRRPNVHGYSGAQGIPSLRAAFLALLRRRGVQIDGLGCVAGAGSKELISHLSQALLEQGDIVLVPELAYPFYEESAIYAGADIVSYPLSNDGRFLPQPWHVREETLARAKLLWLNTPHNPTGTVLPRDSIAKVIDFCRSRGIVVACDLAYSEIAFQYDSAPTPFLGIDISSESVVEIHSLSKNVNVAGWRIGFMVGDPGIIRFVARARAVSSGGMFVPLQLASEFALTNYESISREIREQYRIRTSVVTQQLAASGVTHIMPEGTFYVWVKVPGDSCDLAFSETLLKTAQILVTPGSTFGRSGKGWVRISLTRPLETLGIAINRFIRFCENWEARNNVTDHEQR
jgi:aspartate/methionine/tyrosine aminotransferase